VNDVGPTSTTLIVLSVVVAKARRDAVCVADGAKAKADGAINKIVVMV
jgi:hypothetical protein